MKPKLLLLDTPTEQAKEILDQHVEYATNKYDADIIYTQLTTIKTMKPVFTPCTGTDHVHSPHVIHLDSTWKQNEGKLVTSTAEHTWSLILQAAKKKKMQLSGKTLGIIGYGRIGKQVAKYAEAFNMNVDVIDKNDYCMIHRDWYTRFNCLLSDSDIVTIHVPYNQSTHHLIGLSELVKMKPNSILVNTSRPDIVNIDSLEAVLNHSRMVYANDFDQLKYHPQVIATAHVGGNCHDARIQTDLYIANKILEYIKE